MGYATVMEIVGVKALAAALGVTRPTVYAMMKDGRLPARDVAGLFWSDGLVERIMANRPTRKAPGRPKGAR